jgi:hypothetical protein
VFETGPLPALGLRIEREMRDAMPACIPDTSPAPQLDTLSDDELRAAARSMDPWARDLSS